MSTFTPIRDENGQIIGMMGQDIAQPASVRIGIAPDAQRRFGELLPEPPHEQASERPTSRHVLLRQWQRIGLATGAVLLAALFIWLTMASPRGSSRAFEEAATATARPATAVPTAAPTTGTNELVLAHAVVAYAAPAGDVLGALEAGRPYRLIARSGVDWRQILAGSAGAVWVRTVDLPEGADISVPDLATPTPPVAPVVQATAPAVIPPAMCDEASAPYHVSREVVLNDRPVGRVVAWSCISAANAEAQAAQQEAQVRATAQATEAVFATPVRVQR
jgi:hypothetical protein